MWWDVRGPYTKPRTMPVRSVVLHHTKAESPPARVFRNLCARGLSVQFMIGHDGDVWQFADARDTVCWHAGHANAFSVGVEIVSKGCGTPDPNHAREMYLDQLNGKMRQFLRFSQLQVLAAHDLSKLLCELHSIPFAVVGEPGHEAHRYTMSRHDYTNFRGVLGHYHISPSKRDPSPHILDEIKRASELGRH